MRKILRLLAVAAALCLPASGQAIIITGSHITDASGAPVNDATITFAPSLAGGTPASFRYSPAGGQSTVTPVSAEVTAGAFNLSVASSATTVPANICYTVTLTVDESGDSLLGPGYSCVQPSPAASWCTATACNFDLYQPTGVPGVLATTGPAGLSAYQTWLGLGNTGTAAQFIASLQGIAGTNGTNGVSGANGSNGVASLPALALAYGRLPLGVNFFDPTKELVGYIDSGVLQSSSNYITTGHITANAGGQMSTSKAIVRLNYWDQNDAFQSTDGTGVAAGGTFTVPATAAYVTVTYVSYDAPAAMVVWGDATHLPSTFQRFAAISTSDVAAAQTAAVSAAATFTESTRSYLTTKLGYPYENLFNPTPANYTMGYYNAGSAGAPNNGFNADSNYLTATEDVRGISQVVLNKAIVRYFFLDANGDNTVAGVVADTPAGTVFTIPAGTVTASFTLNITESLASTVEVLRGAVLPPYFVPFVQNKCSPIQNGIPLFSGDSNTANNMWQPTLAQILCLNYSAAVYPLQTSLKGAWSAGTAYAVSDLVYRNNIYYSALLASTGVDPATDNGTYWMDAAAHTNLMGYSGHQTSDAYYNFAINSALQPSGPTIVQQLAQSLSNKNVMYLQMGTNDNGTPAGAFGDAPYVPSGTITQIGDTFTASTSFFGSVEYAVQTALAAIQLTGRYIPLIYMTPHHTDRLTETTTPLNIYQLTAAIKQVCARYGVPVIDQSATVDINSFNWTRTMYTESSGPYFHVHYNTVGGQMVGVSVAHQTLNYLQTP